MSIKGISLDILVDKALQSHKALFFNKKNSFIQRNMKKGGRKKERKKESREREREWREREKRENYRNEHRDIHARDE